MNKRALIVDDHPIIRDALVTSLVSLGVFEQVETASTFQQTLDKLEQSSDYQLLILDLSLTDKTGTEGMVFIREHYPDVPVVVFSGNDSTDTIAQAFEWGCHGFVSKSSQMQVVVNAIKMVLAGSSYIPPSAIRMMGYEPNQETESSGGSSGESAWESAEEAVYFSPKQREVFDQLMLGVPNKVIADRLNMAEGTVKTHLHSIYQILKVRNRAQAILKSRQLRLIA
jgi:DNA-binding NarL/FixJ family response regulator